MFFLSLFSKQVEANSIKDAIMCSDSTITDKPFHEV